MIESFVGESIELVMAIAKYVSLLVLEIVIVIAIRDFIRYR